MVYQDTMNQQRLIRTSEQKVFLILDNLKVHHGKLAAAWLEKNKEKIEVFFREYPKFCVTAQDGVNRAKVQARGRGMCTAPLHRHISGIQAACQGASGFNQAFGLRNRLPTAHESCSNPGVCPSISW